MTFGRCGLGVAAALFLALTPPAGAQENLDSGKTGAQLFASDCAICHKNPQSVRKSGGMFGLTAFLREHYTASHESAASIAKYLDSLGAAPSKPAAKRSRSEKRMGKTDAKEKAAGKDKPAEAKTSSPKHGGPKSEAKTEPKSKSEAKTDAKTDAKTEDKKTSAATPEEAKAGAAKPQTHPSSKPDQTDKPAKPD